MVTEDESKRLDEFTKAILAAPAADALIVAADSVSAYGHLGDAHRWLLLDMKGRIERVWEEITEELDRRDNSDEDLPDHSDCPRPGAYDSLMPDILVPLGTTKEQFLEQIGLRKNEPEQTGMYL
jgi:hypothetical protein